MIMDPTYTGLLDNINSSKVDEQTLLNSDEFPNSQIGLKFDVVASPDISYMNYPFEPPDPDSDSISLPFTVSPGGDSFPSSGWSPEGGEASSPSEDNDSTDPVLKYISQMLMEENMEDQPFMLDDPLALNATEKSLYDAIGEQIPLLDNYSAPYVNHESPYGSLSGSGIEYGGNTTYSSGSGSGSTSSPGISSGIADRHVDVSDHQLTGDVTDAREFNPNFSQTLYPGDSNMPSKLHYDSQFTVNSSGVIPSVNDGFMGSSASEMVQNMFSDNDSVLQFKRGLEEASRFLPSVRNLVIDVETNNCGTGPKEDAPVVVMKQEKIEREKSLNVSKGRKMHQRENSDLEEGRSSKQSAQSGVFDEEGELTEMFDKVLLWHGVQDMCAFGTENHKPIETVQPEEETNKSNGGKARGRRQSKKTETVDLRSLLILCAQSISANDFRTANELLKQIRQHSNPKGDGSQRLAHYFANGLEARLVGTDYGNQGHHQFCISKRMRASDVLKAYKIHLSSCPFKKLTMFFSNKMIYYAAEKATTLHIVDFGVMYGFQWPILIQKLSMRAGGPPKLRITGIELPQQGFRPTDRIEETGRRLAKYCQRFGVPFEYNPIAAKDWESIPIEDLKIKSSEVLAVNSLYRFKNLFDETAEVNCPRDAVLNLIRKMNPDIFVHGIISGSYNAPFFLTRFREALFHYSSVFDMFDSTLPRENEERLFLEGEFVGREAMNAVACEGLERVERPETYKQWHNRTTRAGFKPMPLNQEIFKACKDKLKSLYHKDFVIDEDNHWMLLGWKGRIIYASSCWVPA